VAKNKVAEKLSRGWEFYEDMLPFASGKGKGNNVFRPGSVSGPSFATSSELISSDDSTPSEKSSTHTASQLNPSTAAPSSFPLPLQPLPPQFDPFLFPSEQAIPGPFSPSSQEQTNFSPLPPMSELLLTSPPPPIRSPPLAPEHQATQGALRSRASTSQQRLPPRLAPSSLQAMMDPRLHLPPSHSLPPTPPLISSSPSFSAQSFAQFTPSTTSSPSILHTQAPTGQEAIRLAKRRRVTPAEATNSLSQNLNAFTATYQITHNAELSQKVMFEEQRRTREEQHRIQEERHAEQHAEIER